ncbi:MAG TPA: DNA repair exonuclease [Rhizomicrobium sp.]|jgi:DNA repair exonuclease SbcCD nuclease subunit|nr:DNA repair exonuclease [Rhizomicrobium sp.]
MPVRLLHTADWQIGKRFSGFGDEAGVLLCVQRLKTVERVAALAAERNVDVVLVAGDVCETNTVKDETLRRLMNATRAFGGPWILLPGNHDSALVESVWTRMQRLGLPGNLRLALTPEPILLLGDSLAILPAPLQRRHEARDITEWFDEAKTPDHAVRVGLAHGSVANRLPRPSEAPNTIADDRSERARLDYFALGDWHGTLGIAPRTWYSGTPEPDRFRDNDPGNVLIVALDGPGAAPIVERVPVGHFCWTSIEQRVSREEDANTLDESLAAAPEPERIVAELRLSGTVDLALRRRIEDVVARHAARYHVLRTDMEALVAEPTDDDLDRIDRMGFIRAAIDELRLRARNPADPEQQTARAALERLYVEHLRLGG